MIKLLTPLLRNELSCCARRFSTSTSCRKGKQREEYDDDGLPKDYKAKNLKAGSRRLDTFVNRATGKASSQVEKLILQGKVRVNDDVHTKKAYNVAKDDVIEVWISPYTENTSLANVERTEIVDYEVTESGYTFQVKSWKNFLSDNWRSSN